MQQQVVQMKDELEKIKEQILMSSNKVIIFSAPSGAGKTTVVKHLLQNLTSQLSFSISACSRALAKRSQWQRLPFFVVEDFKKGIEISCFWNGKKSIPIYFTALC